MRCRTKTMSLVILLLMIVGANFTCRSNAQGTIKNWKPNIPKSYPVYAPGKEPPGYWDWLKQQAFLNTL